MGIAKLDIANMLPTMHPSSNPPLYNLYYIKVEYRLWEFEGLATFHEDNHNLVLLCGKIV